MDPRRLRDETRAEHEATEGLMPLSVEAFSRETYVRTLEILYPLITSWERWAESAAPASLRALLPARRRSPLLQRDLQEMQGNAAGPAAVMPWNDVLQPHTGEPVEGAAHEAQFLGALYVMEGSTLGGRFLARHAEEKLGLQPGQGDAYFRGHGEATGAMWREVTDRIAAVPDALAPVVVLSAKKTFHLFGEALKAGASPQEVAHG